MALRKLINYHVHYHLSRLLYRLSSPQLERLTDYSSTDFFYKREQQINCVGVTPQFAGRSQIIGRIGVACVTGEAAVSAPAVGENPSVGCCYLRHVSLPATLLQHRHPGLGSQLAARTTAPRLALPTVRVVLPRYHVRTNPASAHTLPDAACTTSCATVPPKCSPSLPPHPASAP